MDSPIIVNPPAKVTHPDVTAEVPPSKRPDIDPVALAEVLNLTGAKHVPLADDRGIIRNALKS